MARVVGQHRETLDRARAAIRTHESWSASPEHFGPYGEDGAETGKAAFGAYLGS